MSPWSGRTAPARRCERGEYISLNALLRAVIRVPEEGEISCAAIAVQSDGLGDEAFATCVQTSLLTGLAGALIEDRALVSLSSSDYGVGMETIDCDGPSRMVELLLSTIFSDSGAGYHAINMREVLTSPDAECVGCEDTEIGLREMILRSIVHDGDTWMLLGTAVTMEGVPLDCARADLSLETLARMVLAPIEGGSYAWRFVTETPDAGGGFSNGFSNGFDI